MPRVRVVLRRVGLVWGIYVIRNLGLINCSKIPIHKTKRGNGQ
jgi:hypothetical protein